MIRERRVGTDENCWFRVMLL